MKTKKLLLAAILILTSINSVKAQEVIFSKNSIFIELLGNGGAFSFNYERSFKPKLNGRIGFCSFKSIDLLDPENKDRITTIPVMITYFTGQKGSHFEIGGGMLFGTINEDIGLSAIIDLTAFLGYRYHAPGNGMLIRIGLTPFLALDNKANYPDKGLFLSGGLSLGYHFWIRPGIKKMPAYDFAQDGIHVVPSGLEPGRP